MYDFCMYDTKNTPVTYQEHILYGIPKTYLNLVWYICLFSKIQLVVYYQCCILIGWATTRLYVKAH